MIFLKDSFMTHSFARLKISHLIFLLSCCLILLFVQIAVPQDRTVRVYGKVTDTEGGKIAGAKVTFTSHENGMSTSTETDSLGLYSVNLTITETAVDGNHSDTPQEYHLYQNYPNPFNPGTVISFYLPRASEIQLLVFNTRGQRVRRLAEGIFPAGTSRLIWDGTDDAGESISAGIYFYQMIAEGFRQTKKMLLLDGSQARMRESYDLSGTSLLKSMAPAQKNFTVIVEKVGFSQFIEEHFVISTEDSVVEKNVSLKRVDYFPLQVGNYWIYEEQNWKREPDIKAAVLDSITIRGKIYYEVDGFNFTSEYGYSFLRSDSTGRLLGLYGADSSEIMLYDLTASVGDTWSFPAQNYNALVIVLLADRSSNASLQTPAGTFEDIVTFQSHFENVGSLVLEIFAPNVGVILTAVENESWVLKGARINGKTLPDSTIVGLKEKAWKIIKAHERENNFSKDREN